MNLSDLPEDELKNVKEVCLCIRDIAKRFIPNRRISAADEVIFSTEEFEVMLISNCVVLKKLNGNESKWNTRFCFAANYDDFPDDRPYSTRYNKDKGRYVIRHSAVNSILLLTDKNVYNTTVQGNEEYLPVLVEHDNFNDMESEIFQRSLVETTDAMNIIMLNHLLHRHVPYECDGHDMTFHGHIQELPILVKAFEHIEDLRKLC